MRSSGTVDEDWEPPGGPRQPLTRALLAEYEELLSSHQVPIVRTLRPGRSETEIRSVLGRIGLTAPSEALIWWSWHDAARPGEEVAVGARVLSLEDAAIGTLQAREVAAEVMRGGAGPEDWTEEYLWNPSWLKFLHTDGTDWALDTARADASPVHYVNWWDDPARRHIPLTRSLGDLVQRWIAALDAGSMYFDKEQRMWQVQEATAGPRMYQSGRW